MQLLLLYILQVESEKIFLSILHVLIVRNSYVLFCKCWWFELHALPLNKFIVLSFEQGWSCRELMLCNKAFIIFYPASIIKLKYFLKAKLICSDIFSLLAILLKHREINGFSQKCPKTKDFKNQKENKAECLLDLKGLLADYKRCKTDTTFSYF